MYYTHHFAHQETLRRAYEWLEALGYRPSDLDRRMGSIPVLGIALEPGQMGEVELLINAIESTDPEGWPGVWDESMLPHLWNSSTGDEAWPAGVEKRPSPIGWHPLDASRRESPEIDLLRDVMGH